MLAASRILFLLVGLFWLLIGVLAALLQDRGIGPTMLFISHRTDEALFGAPPEEILATNSELVTLRYMTIRTLAGLLVAVGLLTAGIAWFGLRAPQAWPLALVTALGLVVLPFWWITLGPYRTAGIRVGLGDIPPFMWVPAILMPLASTLGWIGYLRA